jgi:hypothetical protein
MSIEKLDKKVKGNVIQVLNYIMYKYLRLVTLLIAALGVLLISPYFAFLEGQIRLVMESHPGGDRKGLELNAAVMQAFEQNQHLLA